MFENYTAMIYKGIVLQTTDLIYLIPVFLFMLIASVIDAKTMKIPNVLNYTMMLLRLGLSAYIPLSTGNIFGFLLGGALILIPAMAILKPMGGDIKFSAALGLWIGDVSILITLIIAVVAFLVYGFFIKKIDKKESMAFAPFISLSYILLVIIGFLI